MTNTIPNVPRELLADLLGNDHDKRIMAERHLLAMLANAPSPANHVEDVRAMVAAPSSAGVDGLEVETYLHTMHMELGQTEQFCSKWKGDPFGIAGEDYSSTYAVTSEPLCRLSGAQAIIDGLRGEVAKINSDRLACWAEFKVMTRACLDAEKERDQQAQRIGELEGLLRDFAYHTQRREMPTESSLAEWADRIDAALAAVCAAAPNIATTSEHSGS